MRPQMKYALFFSLCSVDYALAQNSSLPKLFYINLDRRPDRREFMESEFKREGIQNSFDVIRFPAIDGKTHPLPQNVLPLFGGADFKDKYNFQLLAANQLSHLTLWIRFMHTETDHDYALIFQDDACLKKNFVIGIKNVINNMPNDTAVIWLGMHRFADRSFSLPFLLDSDYDPNSFSQAIVNNSYVGHASMNACSLAYILTKKGAKDLVEHFQSYGFQRATDNAMNTALTMKNRNYISRNILCTGAPDFMLDSDVFGEDDLPDEAKQVAQEFLDFQKEYDEFLTFVSQGQASKKNINNEKVQEEPRENNEDSVASGRPGEL